MKRENTVRMLDYTTKNILSSDYDDEIQRTLRVMAVLNKDYSAIYFVDLDKDSYTSYLNSGTPNESALEIVKSQGTYTSAMKQCIEVLVAEEDREWLSVMTERKMLRKRLEKESEFFIRYRAAANENGQIYFEMKFVASGAVRPDRHQVVIGFHCVDEEIRREEELKRKLEAEHQEKDYQRVLTLHHALRSSMWGFEFDDTGMVRGTDFGEAFRTMMGFDNTEVPITFEECFERIHPEDRENIRKRALEILSNPDTDRQHTGEFRIRNAKGEYRWFHVSGKVFRRTENLFSFMAVLTDVNEETSLQRTLSEEVQQLEKTSDRLKSALEEANLNNEIISAIAKIYWLIYRMDLRTDTYEEISSGEEIHRLTGKHGKTTEVFREVRENVVAPEYQEIMREFLDTSTLADRLVKEETISIEYLAANGQWHLGRFIVKKRDENGRVLNVLYVAHVIDARKKRELEYQKKLRDTAEEAERANIAKTDFLRRMSHDIRTPINGIRGMVEIANHYENDIVKLKECRAKIWDASGYLLSLVNNVLDMNKLESGNIILEEEKFDLCQLLDETRAVVGIQAIEYGIDFQIDVPEEKIRHRYLLGSPAHLKQVLMNLATNAVKYNREGGRVSVSCEELSSDDTSAVFRFVCQDTGIGMSEEFQKRAFEPFSQEKKDARSTFTGSGLGLSITESLVKHMGGTIELRSKENVGTTFTVTIPVKLDQTPPAAEKKEHRNYDISGKKALIVEDNELNMEIARFMLEHNGLIVDGVMNGKEAVDAFAKSKPGDYDVIFMDVMMPVMNGMEATKYIRAMDRPDAKTIPIFAMTANAFKDDIRASAQAGMNEHLTKPLDEGRIVQVLQKYMAD